MRIKKHVSNIHPHQEVYEQYLIICSEYDKKKKMKARKWEWLTGRLTPKVISNLTFIIILSGFLTLGIAHKVYGYEGFKVAPYSYVEPNGMNYL